MSHTLMLANDLAELERLQAWVQAWGQDHGLGQEDVFALQLALEEVAVNVLQHAYAPGQELGVRVDLDLRGGWVWAQVTDQGPAFDPLAAPDPPADLPLEQREPGGWGVALTKRFMHELRWRRQGQSNILTMGKQLGRGPRREGT